MPVKLLVADDSTTTQRVFELTFADQDVAVIAVNDGHQAIERVRAERPDVVLVDVAMPGRDGYDVAEAIKRDPELSHVGVLMLTGARARIDEDRLRAIGCDGVLVKPFEPQVVIGRVREVLAGRRRGQSGLASDLAQLASAPLPTSDSSAQAAGADDYFRRLDAAFGQTGSVIPDRSQEPSPRRGLALSDAFAVLLAAERGETLAAPLPAAALSEEFVDEVARRVIARMGDESMRRAVLDTAERLVREEIDRIKNRAKAF